MDSSRSVVVRTLATALTCLRFSQPGIDRIWHWWSRSSTNTVLLPPNEFPAGPNRDKYTAAAQNIRLPYWDWAVTPQSGSSLPSILTTELVQLQTPRGPLTVANPLFSYNFHPLNVNEVNTPYPRTVRFPDSQGKSQNVLVARLIDANRESMRQRVYSLFTTYTDFRAFGSNAWARSSRQDSDSLEGCHDTIHGTVGRGGQMGVVAHSAFDPIFWLHHCMVDRIFAIWQATNPNSYVQTDRTYTNSYTTLQNTLVDGTTRKSDFEP